jgi:hypothetical protein
MKYIAALALSLTLACASSPTAPTLPNEIAYPWALWVVTVNGDEFLFDAPLLVRDGCVWAMRPGNEMRIGCGKIEVRPHE